MIKDIKMGPDGHPLTTVGGRRVIVQTTVDPLFEDRVTVHLAPPRETIGGFLIPESARARTREGMVTHVGPQARGEWGSLAVGDLVVVATGVGIHEHDVLSRQSYIYVRPSDIIGKLKVVEREETDAEYQERVSPPRETGSIIAAERERLRAEREIDQPRKAGG